MALLPLMVVLIFNFILSLYLLNRYGNLAKHNILVTTSVFVAWFFSFNIIFILPLDITSTIYNQCISENKISENISDILSNNTYLDEPLDSKNETILNICRKPSSYIPTNVLLSLWKNIYWSCQVLTWIILPIFQSYSMSGEFTILRKIRSSLIENLKYYSIFAGLFIIFLIYYISKESFSFEGLKVFCISSSNTFGLFLLLVLLGYGLVEIPRTFFLNYSRDHKKKLDYLYFKVAKLNGEKCEAEQNLDDLLDEIRNLYYYASSVQSIYCSHLNIIINKCPETFKNEILSQNSNISSQNLESQLNEQHLVKLNALVKKAIQTNHRTQVQYELLLQELINHFERKNIKENWFDKNIPIIGRIFRQNILIHRQSFMLLACYILSFFSIMIIWSEFTFFIKTIPVSLFALIVKLLHFDYIWIELFSMLSIAYLSTCCYYTIFKIRFFNYYYLAKHQQTDEYSLIFSGMLLCRLSSPLCLNFLSLIHLDSHITKQSIIQETAFTQIMGHMDTISFISDYLFIYLPVIMGLFCVATFLKIDSKIVNFIGIDQFSIDQDTTQDLILAGEAITKREIQKRSREKNKRIVESPKRISNQNFSRPNSREQLLYSSDVSPEDTKFNNHKNLFDDI